MKRFKFTLVLTIILVLVLSIGTVYAYPAVYQIGVQKEKQEKSFWCWDACSVSILAHYNINVSQSNFCTTVKGSVVNEPASCTEVRSGLSSYGLNSSYSSSYLGFNSICLQTYNYDRPVLMGWLWSSGGGHMLLVDGYDTSFGDYVSYMDPSDGNYHYSSYSYVKGGSSYNHTWLETVYKFN